MLLHFESSFYGKQKSPLGQSDGSILFSCFFTGFPPDAFSGFLFLPFQGFLPGFLRFILQKLGKGSDGFLRVVFFQALVIQPLVLVIHDQRRVVMGHEIIVQQGPAGSAVAVRKWVDILKYRVEVRSCPDHVHSTVFADFLQQTGHVLRHTVCRAPTSFFPVM